MLRSLKNLKGYLIETRDAVRGSVDDFYFDDLSWAVRYLVADTGALLPGRRVLISPASFLAPDWSRRVFPVDLTKEQVLRSPEIDAAKPVSRQKEIELSTYYHWPAYWMGTPWFMIGVPPLAVDRPSLEAARREQAAEMREAGDPHLRSFKEIIRYRAAAKDGVLGRAADMIVDDSDWVIRYVVIDASPWLPGGHVLISPSWIKEVRWLDKRVAVDLTRGEIKGSPAYHAGAPINRRYETRLYDYYGRPRYWSRLGGGSARRSANRAKPPHPPRQAGGRELRRESRRVSAGRKLTSRRDPPS